MFVVLLCGILPAVRKGLFERKERETHSCFWSAAFSENFSPGKLNMLVKVWARAAKFLLRREKIQKEGKHWDSKEHEIILMEKISMTIKSYR